MKSIPGNFQTCMMLCIEHECLPVSCRRTDHMSSGLHPLHTTAHTLQCLIKHTTPCSRGVKIVADRLINDVAGETYDLIACPGGMPGAERLRDSATLVALMQQQRDAGRLHAAMCATPAVFLQTKGLLEGRKATAHPAFSDKLAEQSAVSDRVVVDGTLVTSRGPGTAFEFALELVKQLYGVDKAKEVRVVDDGALQCNSMLIPWLPNKSRLSD